MQSVIKECRKVAEEAALAGGEILRAHRFQPLEISHKDRQEIVTNVDHLSDDAICAVLRRAFPDYTIVSEESGTQQAASPYTWIVDPLDGTDSYVRGMHISGVTVALAYAGRLVLGVVYHPFYDELYVAVEGESTTVNGHAVHVTDVEELAQARLIMDYSPRDAMRQHLNGLEWDRGIKQMYRFGGSIALNMCQVAKGAVDGYIYGRMRNRVKSWDIAAATLLVQGAGGKALDREGDPLDPFRPQGFVWCGNAHLNLADLCRDAASSH